MSGNSRRATTFIVRIWMEPREVAAETEEWRGEIQHVPSGRVLRFQHLEGLLPRLKQLVDEGVGSS